uniref:Transport and Golgi organization protein 1 homolog n=1 Tax=Falco tinnunculus TaxID=100819 RepID=A0A8C4UW82_FALTI
MAAAPLPDHRLLLALLLLLPLPLLLSPSPPALCAAAEPDLGRRFAERKRCADPECSMLMCRGKAVQDFKGPDCRFVNFKKGEAVYVYYKLIGKSTELWAGSVGSDFGYFPKDLLEINHNYSNEELELPTDETDFVCFDGGRDDFDNYNVDELLKSLQETTANEGDTESNDPQTKPAEGIERDEEIEQVDEVKSLNALETDNLELSTEEKEAPAMTEEVDSSLTEGTENTGGDSSVNSHKENSQGDQIAHEHLKGMLHGKLKGLESENTKNTSIPQGETSQLDDEDEEVNAYTLLNRELSANLKTKFGSTADAVVSDDEVTRLVTSLEDDFNEDLSINAHDAEEEPEFTDQSEEIPLLSFMAEEEITSPVDSEDDENDDIESQSHEPDEHAKGATELNNQRDNEEEPDSDALILKDAFSKSKKSGDSISVDRSESKQTKEKQDEVMLINKREAPATTQPEDLFKEHLRKEPVGTGDLGSKEQTNKTEQFEEQLMADGTETSTEELKSKAVPDPHVLPSPGDDLESKSFVKSKQDALNPSTGNSNKSPEGVPFARIEKDEKKFEDDTLEEVLENDFKHRKRWEKAKKGRAENKLVDVPAKPVEDVKNASQSDLGDTDLLKEKLEHGMTTVEKEPLRHEEDLKQTGETDDENKKTASLNKEPEIKWRNMKETPAGEGDASRRGAVEQPRPWENETEYSEVDVKEELSRNLGKMTVFEESIEKSSPEEKSRSTTQNTKTEYLTQQRTTHTEDRDSDRNLGTNLAKERTPRPEWQSEEPDAKDDPDLKPVEEELLEDENAASAKLLQARAANVQGGTLNVKSTNPDLEVPSEAVSGTANPIYETGEETNTISKEAKKTVSMQDASQTGSKEADVPESEGAELDEMEHVMKDDNESSEAEEPLAAEQHKFQFPDIEDNNDFNQRKGHLPGGISQKDSKEVQNLEHTRNDHQQSVHFSSPTDNSAATDDTVTDFSESVKQLTIMRDFLDEKRVIRLQKYLGRQHVVRVEAMFHDMKVEMELARKASHNNEDIEKALDQILEFSESSIMDVVGKVLDSRVAENKEEVVKEMDLYDEESALMDDIQELIYSLRSKYSSASDSVPLASIPEQEDDLLHFQGRMPRRKARGQPSPAVRRQQAPLPRAAAPRRRGAPGERRDAGRRPAPPHGEPWMVLWFYQRNESIWQTAYFAAVFNENILIVINAVGFQLVATLPEEIRPGPDFHGLPWEPIIITALVGIATLAIIFWRTCLSVMTEKQLAEKIKNLLQEKTEILEKMSEYDQKVQIALNEAKLSEEKVKSELHHVQEENARLKKSKEQLLKEAEGWSERHAELSEQIKLYQKSQKDLEEALAYKENEIEVLTNCIMQLKQLDMDSASEAEKDGEGCKWASGDDLANGELPGTAVLPTGCSLCQQIKKLEHDSCLLQSAKARLENDCKTLQQKVEILGELYQQKEMALQKKLTQEEYERQEKEQKLSAADEKAVLAIEEVKVYKQRIQDMEEELQKTERSYKNQIAAHEKKAHDNWLIARSAERALAEEKREAANLRQKLIEVNQKIVMLQRPLIVKPTPGRPDRPVPPRRGPLSRDGSFGPSPVSGGNPSPTQMIEVPARPLSAPRREGSRGEFGSVVDGPPVPRRPPELPGRMSVPGRLCGLQPTAIYSVILSLQKWNVKPIFLTPRHVFLALFTDLGPAVASLISSRPRTSSPSTGMDGVVS